MLLIDALYINNSGGKILLDYLVSNLEKQNITIYYLLDIRIEKSVKIKKTNKVKFLKAKLWSRFLFYKNNKEKFNKVLCFGNLPPLMKMDIPVYTYFHQQLYIEKLNNLNLIDQVKLNLKIFILNSIKKNTDFWLVQSENVKKGLISRYKLNKESILILPFYPQSIIEKKVIRNKKGLVYISTGHHYKNHQNLIVSFCKFYDIYREGELHLTVGEEFTKLNSYILENQIKKYPIINHGFVNKERVIELYNENEYLIYPSLFESFGLGIVEAIENGCKVLGADLPYMHSICEPSLVFDPNSIENIIDVIKQAITGNIKESKSFVTNEVERFISILN